MLKIVSLKVVSAAVALVLAAPGLAFAADLAGVPHILSGDTVTLGKTHLHLAGVAAPRPEQICLDASSGRWTCGLSAREELARHVGNQAWTCQTLHSEHAERVQAKCTVGAEDIGKWLVRSGWAIAATEGAKDYEPEEAEAKSAKAGLWAGAFVTPHDWRRRNAQAPKLGALEIAPASHAILLRGHASATPPSPDCAIKGHVNSSGTCIYHLPGGRWYARVSMQPDNGDRWFCSREEAELASCRETKR